jgi:hypothetical protein
MRGGMTASAMKTPWRKWRAARKSKRWPIIWTLEQSKLFSWERCAAETMQTYEKALAM